MNSYNHTTTVSDVPSVEFTYQKEAVEHLVEQLIRLNDVYDLASRTGYKHLDQLLIAMGTINNALEGTLKYKITLNG